MEECNVSSKIHTDPEDTKVKQRTAFKIIQIIFFNYIAILLALSDINKDI